jgi:tight adherence protein C
VSAAPAVGALLGLGVAAGTLVAGRRWHALRRPRLADRVAPYVRTPAAAPPPSSTAVAHGPLGTLVALVRPTLDSLTGGLRRRGDVSADLRARLARAGRRPDPDKHRLEQVVWAAAGLGVGLLVALVVLSVGGGSVPALLVLVLLSGVAALALHDHALTVAGRKRARRIDAQLPTVAELLAFAVSAGESAGSALDRIARIVRGDLGEELAAAMVDVRTGVPLETALRDLCERTGSPAVERLVDGVVVAAERGSPLSDVLRAQASDARALGQRQLMESAGRRDVVMLVPVVFLVLPTVVVVALFPGLSGLSLTVP